LREIREETGLDVHAPVFCGCSHIDAGQANGILLLIFRAEAAGMAFVDSKEGKLEWVPKDMVLTLDLVEDLPVLLPRVLAMKAGDPPFFVHLSYGGDDEPHLVFGRA